jgi:hypothetical protein
VLELYLDRQEAERDLGGIIHDEPEWEPHFSIREIPLNVGSLN